MPGGGNIWQPDPACCSCWPFNAASLAKAAPEVRAAAPALRGAANASAASHGGNLSAGSCPQAGEGIQQSDLNAACGRLYDEDCEAVSHGAGGDCWKCKCGDRELDPGTGFFEQMLISKGANHGGCCIKNKCDESSAPSGCQACWGYVIKAC